MPIQILMKGQALETFLEQIADAFRMHCPKEYRDFVRHVAQESKALIKPTGMSRDGCFLNRMYIPSKLYTFIKQQARKRLGIEDFFADRRNYYALMRVWKDCETKRKRSALYDAVAVAQNRMQKEQQQSCPTPPKESASSSSSKTAKANLDDA